MNNMYAMVPPAIDKSICFFQRCKMIEGNVIIEVDGKEYLLEEDDGLYFEAAVPHCYRNITDKKAKMELLIYYM